ncbi:MAG: glycosyltransferase family 4 protein [Candidatus Muirbacterium halophilum]|nr:glycosyltransferase family 4 protein [Candidatus Muirbacterium halophilum]MCK9474642.1 glycosyltransferase family 4 protein [Candidatus Muirbacterium halophilum]
MQKNNLNLTICHINLSKGFRGGERQTYILIKELSKKFNQKLIIRNGSPLKKIASNVNNLEIIEIRKPFMLNVLRLKNEKIIHAHEAKAAHISFFTNLLFNIPYIITRRVDTKLNDNFVSIKSHEKANFVIAISKEVKNVLKRTSDKIKIKIIPDSPADMKVDYEKINKIRHTFLGKFIVGNVGALVNKHKGQKYIIECAKKMEKTYPNIHFLFIGSGKDEKILKELSFGLSNIIFIGFVEDVQNYIKALDVFLYPSLNEGLGSAILDAMQLEIPVIATNVGGIPEIIENDKNGILIESKNSEEIYKSVLRLYKEKKLKDKFISNGIKTLYRFDIKNCSDKYIEIYKESLLM